MARVEAMATVAVYPVRIERKLDTLYAYLTKMLQFIQLGLKDGMETIEKIEKSGLQFIQLGLKATIFE